MQLIMFVIYGK